MRFKYFESKGPNLRNLLYFVKKKKNFYVHKNQHCTSDVTYKRHIECELNTVHQLDTNILFIL